MHIHIHIHMHMHDGSSFKSTIPHDSADVALRSLSAHRASSDGLGDDSRQRVVSEWACRGFLRHTKLAALPDCC